MQDSLPVIGCENTGARACMRFRRERGMMKQSRLESLMRMLECLCCAFLRADLALCVAGGPFDNDGAFVAVAVVVAVTIG